MEALFHVYTQNLKKICLRMIHNKLEMQGSNLGLSIIIHSYQTCQKGKWTILCVTDHKTSIEVSQT
jgi:hypothetical protein